MICHLMSCAVLLSLSSQMYRLCFDYVIMRVVSFPKESVSGCQILFWSHFCHANVSTCSTSTGCCCDCGFIDDVILWDIYTFLLWFLIMLAMLHLVGPSGFWLVPENFVFFCPIRIKARGLWVISCVLSQNDPWSSLAHHVCLNRSPLLCSRWKVPISAQNVTDIRSLCENLTSKYAEPFRKDHNSSLFESLRKYSPIHCWCILHWMQGVRGLIF